MKTPYLLLVLLALILCAGCTTQRFSKKEPAKFASFEDFRLGPEDGVDLVWSNRRISDEASLKNALHKYENLLLDQIFVTADQETVASLDEKHLQQIPRQLFNAIESKFGRWFKFVNSPTENTLRLSIALTNSINSKPFFAEPESSLPASRNIPGLTLTLADNNIKDGRVMAELLVSDASSHEPLIATIDKNFSDEDIAALMSSPSSREEAISRLVEHLWTTLVYWNWIQDRPPIL